jgi:hypothetical protein
MEGVRGGTEQKSTLRGVLFSDRSSEHGAILSFVALPAGQSPEESAAASPARLLNLNESRRLADRLAAEP